MNPEKSSPDYWAPQTQVESLGGIGAMLIAYSCQQNLFPIYGELKRKTKAEATAVFGWATGLVSVIYVTLAVVVL